MTSEQKFTDLISRLGLFRVLFAGAVQFNSLAFRLIAGVLQPTILEYVAIVTAIEFSLNAVLEVPFGHISDRIGRVKSSLIGFVLYSLSLVCTFCIIGNFFNDKIIFVLVILNGALIGFGKPLISGSVEGYFQAHIQKHTEPDGNGQKRAAHSMLLSLSTKKFLPSVYIFSSAALIAVFNHFDILEYVFLIGSALYLNIIAFLVSTEKIYPDNMPDDGHIPILITAKKMLCNETSKYSIFASIGATFFAMNILGYLILSLGRTMHESNLRDIAMAVVILGSFMGPGWVAKAILFPKLAKRYTHPQLYLIGFIGLFSINFVMWISLSYLSFAMLLVFLATFMTAFQIFLSLLQDASTNSLMTVLEHKEFSTGLSLQNIPSFALVGILSFIYASVFEGAPPPTFTFPLLAAYGAVCTIIVLVINRRKKSNA